MREEIKNIFSGYGKLFHELIAIYPEITEMDGLMMSCYTYLECLDELNQESNYPHNKVYLNIDVPNYDTEESKATLSRFSNSNSVNLYKKNGKFVRRFGYSRLLFIQKGRNPRTCGEIF